MVAQKRESVLHFVNTAEAGAENPSYAPFNIGFNSADEALNVETQDKQYIGQATGTQVVNRISPNIAYSMNVEKDDPVCMLVYKVHQDRAVDTQIEMVSVFTFETPAEGGYPAVKRTYTIQPETGAFAGAGGEEMELSGNLAEVPGSGVEGTFDTTTRTFTPSAA